jgi:hypothetical protein
MSEQYADELVRLNQRVPIEENAKNRLFFEDLLAPAFAFRRASGALDTREMFLLSVPDAKGERSCDPDSIEVRVLGTRRAIVTCVVMVKNEDASVERFHNVRLFVKGSDDRWKLLAWANERV